MQTKRNIKINMQRWDLGKKLSLILLPVFLLFSLAIGFLFIGGSGKADAAQYPSEYSLRDDYYVQLTDQDQFGNCWAFGNVKAIESWLAINTGEHFEISETYITLTREVSGMLGAGGSLDDFEKAINRNGIVLDVDYSYDDVYYANSDNKDLLLNMLNVDADKYTVKISDVKVANYRSNTSIIKYYITNYGCASINLKNWTLEENPFNGNWEIQEQNHEGKDGHALAVLGWDDNYVASNGSKGAYIILNSYGDYATDGIVYLPYSLSRYVNEKTSLTVSVFSFAITLPDDYVFLNSNANYQVNMKGKYFASTNYKASLSTLKEKNIFDVDDDFNLEYTFPNKQDLEYNIDIYRGDKEVSDQFAIIKDDRNCYVLRKGKLESGTYKLDISYSYTQNNQKVQRKILKQLFLLDELELNSIERANSETSWKEFLVVDSLAMPDNVVHVPQYELTFAGNLELTFVFSPYSNWTSYSLTKGSATIASRTYTAFSPSRYSLTLRIPKTSLNQGANNFTLTFGNAKHTKTYNIVVDCDTNSVYNGEGRVNTKITSLLKIDLDGGSLQENCYDKVMFGTGTFDRYYLPSPYKEGYRFVNYSYYNGNDWVVLPFNEGNQQYFVQKTHVLHATSKNFFTNSFTSYNYKNYILVKANYATATNPIQIHVGGQIQNLFDHSQSISARLNVDNAQNISWFVDGKFVSALQNISLGSFRPGSYLLTVEYTLNGKTYTYYKNIYVKRHVYEVEVDQTSFRYTGQAQQPKIEIQGLVEGVDYTLTYSNSVDAGTYYVKINRLVPIELSLYSVEYKIEKLPLKLFFENIVIKQYESVGEIKFTQEGWIEQEDIKISFDMSVVDSNVVGEYIVPFTIDNWVQAYEIIDLEDPAVVVLPTDFKVEDIGITTSTMSSESATTFNYAQRFQLSLDCPLGMIKNVEYTVNGKTYNKKTQYITDKLPVGEHTITANVELHENKAFDVTSFTRKFKINIIPTDLKIVIKSSQGFNGDDPTNLSYTFDCDYDVVGIDVQLKILNFDKNKIGDYTIIAEYSGNTQNYNIEVVNGVYTVVKKPLSSTVIALIVFGCLFAIMFVFMAIRAYKRKRKLKI